MTENQKERNKACLLEEHEMKGSHKKAMKVVSLCLLHMFVTTPKQMTSHRACLPAYIFKKRDCF